MSATIPDPINTDRLIIQDWANVLALKPERDALLRELEPMLTPAITTYLPLNMGFPGSYASISDWVDDRIAEADVMCIHIRDTQKLAGLLFCFTEPDSDDVPVIHVGYFLGEEFWGRGIGTESLGALVSEFRTRSPIRLEAGVDRENIGSARVLAKSGFVLKPDQPEPGRYYYTCELY